MLSNWMPKPERGETEGQAQLEAEWRERIAEAKSYEAQYGNPVDNLIKLFSEWGDPQTWREVLDEPYG